MSSNTNPYTVSTIGNVSSGVLTGAYSGTITTSANYGNITIRDSLDPTTMRVEIPLVVQGRDVMKELDELRDSVLLLKRHIDMEAKYPKLKELKDAYESQLAKYKTFDAIKESK